MQRYQLWVYLDATVTSNHSWRMMGFFNTREEALKEKESLDAAIDRNLAYEVVAVTTALK